MASDLLAATADFWQTYYTAMLTLHADSGRQSHEPIRDRNLGTTNSSHIAVFERFWRKQLSHVLGVSEAEVGPRVVRFRPYRSKAFDVCWPLKGDPKILISVKSMQNAYRNLTNRIEEAIGDSAVLRLYNSNAVFGFFFFILDGRVAGGTGEQGVSLRKTGAKGIAPFLELIEDGGDFFDLSDIARYRKPVKIIKTPRPAKGRLNSISVAEQSLLDLVSAVPKLQSDIHYDSIAFLPACIKRVKPDKWDVIESQVNNNLSHLHFLNRLVDVARLRGLIE